MSDVSDEMVEKAARALCRTQGVPEGEWEGYAEDANAALTAALPAVTAEASTVERNSICQASSSDAKTATPSKAAISSSQSDADGLGQRPTTAPLPDRTSDSGEPEPGHSEASTFESASDTSRPSPSSSTGDSHPGADDLAALTAEVGRLEGQVDEWRDRAYEALASLRKANDAGERIADERDAARAAVERVRVLADYWADSDGDPATSADLTALTVANRLGLTILTTITNLPTEEQQMEAFGEMG